MCTICVKDYLKEVLQEAKRQFFGPKADSVIVCLGKVALCEKSKLIENKLRSSQKTISFPGRTKRCATTFTILIRLMHLIVTNLEIGKLMTIRDLFYQDVGLFGTQNTVVRATEQLSRVLCVPRCYLGINPSPNGLVAGDINLALSDGSFVEVKRSNGASLIPVTEITSARSLRVPDYILVIEKEAVFSYLKTELNDAIVVTGKGFPDRATRCLLNALTVTYPSVPIYGLVDSDPHGILILRNYEKSATRPGEADISLRIQYLGISLLEYSEGLVPSTSNDKRVAMSTLKKSWIHEPAYRMHKQELQRGLFMGLKGEMNLMDVDRSSRLSAYVRCKIRSFQVVKQSTITPA